jgi:hypothetical protein
MSQRGSNIADTMYLRQEQKDLRMECLLRQDSLHRTVKGLARTFCTQMETLKRCRANSQPSTTVNVAQGAQAIVGVNNAPLQPSKKNRAKNRTAPPRALTDQEQPAMPIIDDSGKKEAVPLRRKIR